MAEISYEQQRMVEQLNYSPEVETDAEDWEMALDGINTVARKLNELNGKPDVVYVV